MDKEFERATKIWRNAHGDYLIRPNNVTENLEILCETLGITPPTPIHSGYRWQKGNISTKVILENFSLYELNKSEISLSDYNKLTGHEGRALFTHFPINLPIRIKANPDIRQGLITEINGRFEVYITAWKPVKMLDSKNNASLFGIGLPPTYEEGSQCILNLYGEEQKEEKNEKVKSLPIYGVSLHIKPI